jgi:dihydropteroate synthase
MRPTDFRTWLMSPHRERRPLVMGILNVTPDSFSDGGRHADPAVAIEVARRMVTDGADLIDVGGESTRPGSQPVPPDEQLRRVLPVVEAVARENLPVTLSIDTTKARVGQASLDAGATVLNDVSGGRDDPDMLPLAAARNVPIVLMHMRGTPATMQANPSYSDVAEDITRFLRERLQMAIDAGVREENVLLDPGIGFGKTLRHDLTILHELPRLAGIGRPLLIGVSRKKFIGRLTGETVPSERIMGTAAAVAWAVANGAGVVRVHDVAAMTKIVRVVRAIIDPADEADG